MPFNKKEISIIIGCRKEGEGIARIIDSVKPYADEIIVVDGHSEDGTAEIAAAAGVQFYLDNRRGRGDALKIGITKATKPYLVFFDADGSHEANDIPSLVEPLITGSADMVIGSRLKGGCLDADLNGLGSVIRLAGSYFMVWLVNRRFKVNLTEILYSFRALKRDKALKLKLRADNFAIEQDMVVRCLKRNYKIVEIPSREHARGWGEAKLKTSMGIDLLRVLIRDLYFSK